MYKDLSLKEKAKVLLYGGKLGLTSVEDIAKLYDEAISHKFAEGSIATPDWDPNNPYHYHTTSGEKVVITPEDWEKHKGLPYFKLVEDAVLAEQAAHPGPEYIINPLFSEDLRRVYKGNMGPKYQNYSSFSGNLPQGYNFTPEGLVLDNQGNLYVLKGFRQTPRFTYDEKRSLVFPVLEGRNQGNVVFYPVNMDKTVKSALSVSRIMDVDMEKKKADEDSAIYLAPIMNSDMGAMTGNNHSYYEYLGNEGYEDFGLSIEYNDGRKDLLMLMKRDINPKYQIHKTYLTKKQYNNAIRLMKNDPMIDSDWIIDEFNKGQWIYPNQNKAVIKVGPLQVDDVLTYAQGGSIVSPYGLWKYPGKDTIIPSNNITMDNVNYPVLGVSDTGDTKIMMPWNNYHYKGSMVYEHPLIDNQFQLGGNTKPTFELWYPTVPKQKNDTSSYDLRRAYNILPFDELEKFRTIDDYHLPSVAYDEKTDTYTFLKRNGHPTLNYELDWYNSGAPDALEFRERYKLDTLSLPWRYIPRTYLEGGNTLNYLNIPEYNIALYNTVSPLGDFPNFWEALAYRRLVKDKLKNGNIYERDYNVGDTLGEKTAMAAWAKRLGIPYDEQDLPVYNGDTVTLPYSLVLEIPYDTNMLKNRIQLNKALLDKYSKYRYSDVVNAAIKADLYNLDKLRETYKTGKPVGLTEFGWNSRLLVNNGEIIPIENIQSPLNVLGNYNVRYSPEERRLYYSDEYDFNQFENFVPGEPYRIRGYIDLDNNKALGGNLFKKGGIYIKPSHRGRFTALKKRTGHSASWFKAHGTPALKKMAVFELNSRHWNKHDEGGHLFLEDGWMNTNLLTLFDKYGPKAQVVEIDKPVRLNEVQVVADAPKPGSLNYDRYIANTYDAWQRGDVDINTLPTETRNRVRGYSGTIAAQKGMNKAGEKLFPYIIGIAGGPAGLLAGATSIGASLLVDSSINNLTKGENETWGDWLSDVFGIENPYVRGAMELTNPAFWPGYIYGGVNAFNKAANSKTIGTLRIANLMRRDINRNKKGLNLALESFNYDNILKERNALAGNSYFHGTTVKPNVDVSPAWGGSLIGKDPGMFVSYGEPWIERSLAKSMYVFPEETFGIRKATDAYGNILKQSVNLLGKNKLATSTAYKVNPILDLAWSKFTGKPEYKAEYVLPNGNVISESARDAFFDIYHGNQTVIPKDLFRYALQNTPYRVHYANGPDRALIEYNPNLGNRFKLSFTEDDYSKFLDDWINGETTMISDIPQTGNTGVRASLSGIKQADKDIPLMSQYHDANVLEYNLATGNNVESVPFRTDVTGRLIKIMPDEEFNQHFLIRKTNSPLDDIERVGGAYSKTDDAVYLRLSGSESNAYHETLHSRKYGETNPEVTQWRMNQMLSDEAVSKMTQRQKEYYLGNGEFPTHMRLLGKDMGISVAQEYPGDDKFVEMLVKKMSDDGIGGAAHFTKIMDIIDNPASVSHIDKMILWKGLNGTAFSILGGVGLYGLQHKINKQ